MTPQLRHRDIGVAAVRANLRHQKDAVTISAPQRGAQPLLGPMVIVLQRVVEEGDAVFDRFVDDGRRIPHRIGVAK
jgi:hypothetical protein